MRSITLAFALLAVVPAVEVIAHARPPKQAPPATVAPVQTKDQDQLQEGDAMTLKAYFADYEKARARCNDSIRADMAQYKTRVDRIKRQYDLLTDGFLFLDGMDLRADAETFGKLSRAERPKPPQAAKPAPPSPKPEDKKAETGPAQPAAVAEKK